MKLHEMSPATQTIITYRRAQFAAVADGLTDIGALIDAARSVSERLKERHHSDRLNEIIPKLDRRIQLTAKAVAEAQEALIRRRARVEKDIEKGFVNPRPAKVRKVQTRLAHRRASKRSTLRRPSARPNRGSNY